MNQDQTRHLSSNIFRFPLSKLEDEMDKLQRNEIIEQAFIVPDEISDNLPSSDCTFQAKRDL